MGSSEKNAPAAPGSSGSWVGECRRGIGVVSLPHDLRLQDCIRLDAGDRLPLAVLRAGELHEHIIPLDHPPKNGVFSIEVLRGPERQEELRAAAVLPGMGHRERAAEVEPRSRLSTLAGYRVAGATGAGARGIAPLGHESGDHSVERRAVVEALFNEAQEVGHRIGGLVFIEFHHNIAGRG